MRVTATLLLWGMCCLGAQASSTTYITPANATVPGGAVNATVTFSTGDGTIEVMLNNLEAGTHDAGQLLSDLSFIVGSGSNVVGAKFGNAASAGLIHIGGSGGITTDPPAMTASDIGWALSEPTATQVKLDVLVGPGHKGPAHTIIGPPTSGSYSGGNGSIKGSPSHNPFISEEATWVINAAGVSSDTTITSATFSFGTLEGGPTVVGTPVAGVIPEPSSMMLLGSGLLVLTQVLRRKVKDAS